MAGQMFPPEMDSWQFSAGHAFLHLTAAEPGETGPEPPGLVDRMAEAVGQLDRATAEGWRLLGVKLLREAAGTYQLDALLGRPRSAAGPTPATHPFTERAA
jgi:hypothetical protein